jgi:hypothetical protein
MSKIPTAEEFLNDTQEGNSIWGDLLKDKGDVFYEEDVKIAMIEFAKLHCEAALKAASENAGLLHYEFKEDWMTKYHNMESDTYGDLIAININSILNAYPIENIK